MSISKKLFNLVVLSMFMFSCATILHGTKEKMSVDSDPIDAQITVETVGGVEVYTGYTPAKFTLEKKHEYNVIVKLDGYKEEKIFVSKKFDAVTLGNIICGGVIGIIVDAANGAMYQLRPNTIVVNLQTAWDEAGQKHVYAVYNGMDSQGQLHRLTIPLIKE